MWRNLWLYSITYRLSFLRWKQCSKLKRFIINDNWAIVITQSRHTTRCTDKVIVNTCVIQFKLICIFEILYEVTKKCFDLKMLSKNYLINLLRKFQLRLHSLSITINTQTNFQIISQYRIFYETCPTLLQNAILWNNSPTWLNNIFEPVRTKLRSGAPKKSLRRCQTLKQSNKLLKDSKLLTRLKTTYSLGWQSN